MDGDYYIGVSENVQLRLEQHNAGLFAFTSTKKPWLLVYVAEQIDKRTALIERKELKNSIELP